MRVVAIIVEGPVTPDALEAARAAAGDDLPSALRDGHVGAVLRFEGIVRRMEPRQDRGGEPCPLLALTYQTYDPMAQRELESLARDVSERHALESLVALHSRGDVAVGEVSFVLEVAAARRAGAIAAVEEFIDRLKQDVPIWKHPVWAPGPTGGW